MTISAPYDYLLLVVSGAWGTNLDFSDGHEFELRDEFNTVLDELLQLNVNGHATAIVNSYKFDGV